MRAKQWDNDRVNVWGLNSYFIHSAGLLIFFNAKLNMLFYFWYWGHILSGKLNSLFKSQTLFGYHDKKKKTLTDERRIRSNYSLSFIHLLISHFFNFHLLGLVWLTRRKQGLTNFQHSLQYLPGRWPIISSMSSLKRSTPKTHRNTQYYHDMVKEKHSYSTVC